MSKRIFSSFLLCILTLAVFVSGGQPAPKVKYWVKFKDKSGTPFSLSNPAAFLTQKTIQRRSTYNIPLHVSDLPVTPSYVKALDTIKHVDVLYASKWLNGAVVAIDSASVAQPALSIIKSFSFVLDTSRVKKYRLHLPPMPDVPTYFEKKAAVDKTTSFNYAGSGGQIRQLKLDCLHEQGYRGQGMTIAVMDVGFINVDSSPVFDSIRNNGGILGGMDFVSGGTYVYQGGTHGTMVFSTLAGNKPNVIIGGAPMAKYWLLRTEDGSSENIVEEYNWVRAAEFADSVGVDMITTSLGYNEFDIPADNHTYQTLNGRTAPMSIAATMAARKGIFVLNAAGNEGGSNWKYIIVPADADSICSVGAVDTSGFYAAFSSVGPTADGRIKPDLVATGANAWVCDQSSTCFPGSGTSFATPILAGGVACYWQKNRQLNNMQLLDALKRSATHANNPNNKVGWGIPRLCHRDLDFDFDVFYSSERSTLTIKISESLFESIQLEIYDLTGKILFSSSIDVSTETIYTNISIAAEGVYLAKLKTSKGTKTKKFYK